MPVVFGTTCALADGMTAIRNFQELMAWQFSTELKERVLEFTSRPAVARHRSFCDDIRRSARSSPANLSEGFARFWPHDNAKFVRTALASLAETQNHLMDAQKENYVTAEEFNVMWRLSRRAFGAATGWHQYLKSCPPGDPSKWLHTPGPIRDDRPATED